MVVDVNWVASIVASDCVAVAAGDNQAKPSDGKGDNGDAKAAITGDLIAFCNGDIDP